MTTDNRADQPVNMSQSSQSPIATDTNLQSSHSERNSSMNISNSTYFNNSSTLTAKNSGNINIYNNQPVVDCHKAWEILNNPSYQLDGHKLQQLLDYSGIYNEEDLVYTSEGTLNSLSLCLKHAARNKFLWFKPCHTDIEVFKELKSTIWSLLQTPDNHKSINDRQLLYTSLSNYGIFDSSHLSGLNEAIVAKLAVYLKEAPKNDFLHDCKLLLSQPRLKPSSPRLVMYPAFVALSSLKIVPIESNTANTHSRSSLVDATTNGNNCESNSANNYNKLTRINNASEGTASCHIS